MGFICKELNNKEFSSKEEMFRALKNEAENIISLKKAEIKCADPIAMRPLMKSEATKAMELDEGFIYPVINTTKYLDFHNDVHLDGIWNKSAKEQKGKVYYVADHELKLQSVIAFPKDVEIKLMDVEWKDLGFNYTGKTQALIYKIAKDKLRMKAAIDVVEEKIPMQNSIRMQYVKIDLAVDSTEDEFKEEKKLFDQVVEQIVNKDVAQERGYFWAVSEAKISQEGSMVLFGSNDATPLMQSKDNEPSKDTQKEEPSHEDTLKKWLY
jgi:hypothetical protein